VESQFPFCQSLSAASRCVFGEGNQEADLVFVGEAPGADEDRLGRPFVGAAGRKLDEIIAAMGFSRASVYICNVLKARPPKNRAPSPEEVALSAPWLYAQLRLIRPKVIIALGGPAAKLLLATNTGITRLRGQMGAWHDPESTLVVPVMPTFHPAYLLRNYTPEVRGQVWADMQAAIAGL
jgi:DNA polymerase